MTKDHAIHWLLEAETPSIRYLALRTIVRRNESDSEVQKAWEDMKKSGPIPAILRGQTDSGAWANEHSYYTPKYTSTHWRMLLLAELHADPSNVGLQQGAEYMLMATEDKAQDHAEQGKHSLECFWGNLLRYELHCGNEDDPRLSNVIRILAKNGPGAGWRCRYNGERPCAWGAARALWGLAALPEHKRTSEVEAAMQDGLSFLLDEYSLMDADYPIQEGGKVHALWQRLNFPLFYQADILFVLRVIAELDALDYPGVQPALEWLRRRRLKNGRWRGANPFRSRTFKELGGRGETDRWISLFAGMILMSQED